MNHTSLRVAKTKVGAYRALPWTRKGPGGPLTPLLTFLAAKQPINDIGIRYLGRFAAKKVLGSKGLSALVGVDGPRGIAKRAKVWLLKVKQRSRPDGI